VQIAVRLQHQGLAFPGDLSSGEAPVNLKYDPEYLVAWIAQELGCGE